MVNSKGIGSIPEDIRGSWTKDAYSWVVTSLEGIQRLLCNQELLFKGPCTWGHRPAVVQGYENHWILKAANIQHRNHSHYVSLCWIDKFGVTVSE